MIIRALRRALEAWRGRDEARELLLACLNPAQRAEFERTRAFTVRGQSGRTYRITYGTMANIEVFTPGGAFAYRLCAAPRELPTPSVMLAQKLMLESCEAEFIEIAVRHPQVMDLPPALRRLNFASRAR